MKRWIELLTLFVCAFAGPAALAQTPELTVGSVRNLPVPELARQLLGERIGSRVIEAVRHEYDSSPSVPRAVDFFTQPVAPWPRINRICQTDVITIEYNWFDIDEPQPSSSVGIFRVEATSRYLAIPEPPGDPGEAGYQRAHEATCAAMTSARDAFRAPDAGDAQWLAAMEEQWLRAGATPRFNFACRAPEPSTCEGAVPVLSRLRLNQAAIVEGIECPAMQRGEQVNYCYRLIFAYSGTGHPEWDMTLVGQMDNGSAPVEIRSLNLVHVARSIPIH